jgi:hypothetical protein
MSYLQQPSQKSPSAENQSSISDSKNPSLFSSVAGPLSVKYCNLLLVFTWIAFIGIIVFILGSLYALFTGGLKNKMNPIQIALGIYQFALLVLVYILYRIYYNMCLHSM